MRHRSRLPPVHTPSRSSLVVPGREAEEEKRGDDTLVGESFKRWGEVLGREYARPNGVPATAAGEEEENSGEGTEACGGGEWSRPEALGKGPPPSFVCCAAACGPLATPHWSFAVVLPSCGRGAMKASSMEERRCCRTVWTAASTAVASTRSSSFLTVRQSDTNPSRNALDCRNRAACPRACSR